MSADLPLHDVYLGLGSNIRPAEFLPRAVRTLADYVTLIAVSQAWETPPYGMPGDHFLNAAAHIRTAHPANILKSMVLRRIEALLGRVRTAEKFSPRTIDLDILVYDGVVMDEGVWTRSHIAVPLAELLPTLTDSAAGVSLHRVAQQLRESTPLMRPRPEVFPPP